MGSSRPRGAEAGEWMVIVVWPLEKVIVTVSGASDPSEVIAVLAQPHP